MRIKIPTRLQEETEKILKLIHREVLYVICIDHRTTLIVDNVKHFTDEEYGDWMNRNGYRHLNPWKSI